MSMDIEFDDEYYSNVIIDIECCKFDDDESYSNVIDFKIRDESYDIITDGSCVDGSIEDAFVLQRLLSKYYNKVYVCILTGCLHDGGLLHEYVYGIGDYDYRDGVL